MKKKTIVKSLVCLIFIYILMAACVMNKLSNSANSIELHPSFNGEPVILRAEINQSADVNRFYTEDNNDWAGQPSLIYEIKIKQLEISGIYELELIGHGGLIKDEAAVYRDLSSFDTALEQVESIILRL